MPIVSGKRCTTQLHSRVGWLATTSTWWVHATHDVVAMMAASVVTLKMSLNLANVLLLG